jgi:hypothetical protein
MGVARPRIAVELEASALQKNYRSPFRKAASMEKIEMKK